MRDVKDCFVGGIESSDHIGSDNAPATIDDWLKNLSVRAITITTDRGVVTLGPSQAGTYVPQATTTQLLSSPLVSALPWLGLGLLLILLLKRR